MLNLIHASDYTKRWARNELDALMDKYQRGIRIVIDQPATSFRISCPASMVCGRNIYRAYTYSHKVAEDLSLFVYVSFKGEIVGNVNPATVQRYFDYAYYILRSSKHHERKWDVRLGTEEPHYKGDKAVQMLGYRDGRLQLRLRDVQLAGQGTFESGRGGFSLPPEHIVTTPRKIPWLSISLDLKLPDGVLDCRLAENRKKGLCIQGGW
jgi:hypothetical protein